MQLNAEVLQQVAKEISKLGIFATQHDVNKFMSDVVAQGQSSRHFGSKDGGTGITQLVRGLAARQGRVIESSTVKADLEYVEKTLVTSATPGSYLVPVIQADAIVEILGK